ncbi:MAG: 30S ribosomal protein S6 [Candidatus Pacebacteria bacterium]|nr:30S ribosomal protein S6 [Candidatus Paceibacterota bacterium]MDD4831008.1 30S ribosomal protein S6 [Candidatus Paceibacterota bacterium]
MEYYDINFLISTGIDKGRMDEALSWLDSKFNVSADSPERKVHRIKLAYPIKKETEAWYYQLKFVAPADMSPDFFEEIQKELKIKKEFIRSLIIKKQDEPIKERRSQAPKIEKSEDEDESSPEEIKSSPESEKEAEPSAESKKEKKLQLQEIDQKLEEILKEE